MKTIKLIKVFDFDESTRKRVVLGANTRLNPETRRVQLKSASLTNIQYPTGPDIQVKTWVVAIHSVKKWIGFECVDVQTIVDEVKVTSCFFRLSNGTNEFYWNGTAWIVNTTMWNNEGEIADNIHLFPVTSKNISVVINLRTSDSRVTPEIDEIKILYEAVIDFQLDLIARTLIPLLKQGVRPLSDYMTRNKTASAISSITLPDPIAKTPYNFTGVDSVFNHTSDPDHQEDLLVSYNPSTRLVTLSEPIPASNDIFLRFEYEPEVILTTSSTYTEVSKVPAILISDIDFVDTRQPQKNETVLNRAAGTGWAVPAPMLNDINFTLNFMTDKESDQYRLADEVKKFFNRNQIIVSKGTSEEFRLWLWDEYIGEGIVGQGDIHGGKIRAKIFQAEFYNKDAYQIATIQRLVMGGDLDGMIIPVEGRIHPTVDFYSFFSMFGNSNLISLSQISFYAFLNVSITSSLISTGKSIFSGISQSSVVGSLLSSGSSKFNSSLQSLSSSSLSSVGSYSVNASCSMSGASAMNSNISAESLMESFSPAYQFRADVVTLSGGNVATIKNRRGADSLVLAAGMLAAPASDIIFGGAQSIAFTGTQWLDSNQPASSFAFTADGSGCEVVTVFCPADSVTNGIFLATGNSGSTYGMVQKCNNASGTHEYIVRNATTIVVSTSAAAQAAAGVATYFDDYCGSASPLQFCALTKQAASAAGAFSATPGTGTTAGTLRLGNQVNGAFPCAVRWCETLIFDRVLSEWERQIVREYIQSRYGIAAPSMTDVDRDILSMVPFMDIRADNYISASSKVTTLLDSARPGHKLSQVSPSAQTLDPTIEAIFGNQLAIEFTNAQNYDSNLPLGAFSFLHSGSGCQWYLLVSATNASNLTWSNFGTVVAGTGSRGMAASMYPNVTTNNGVLRNIDTAPGANQITVGSAKILKFKYATANSPKFEMKYNGNSVLTGGENGTPSVSAEAQVFRLGKIAASFGSFKFERLLMFNRTLTAGEEARVAQMFLTRNGIVI